MNCLNKREEHRGFLFDVMHPFRAKIVSLIVKAYHTPLKEVWRTFGRVISSLHISKGSPEVSELGIESIRREGRGRDKVVWKIEV